MIVNTSKIFVLLLIIIFIKYRNIVLYKYIYFWVITLFRYFECNKFVINWKLIIKPIISYLGRERERERERVREREREREGESHIHRISRFTELVITGNLKN